MVDHGSSGNRHPAAAIRLPRGIVIALAPHSQPSRPSQPGPLRVESLPVAPAGRDWRARAALQRRRWRDPTVGQATRRFVLALVLLLHGLFGLVAWYATRAPPLAPPPPPPAPSTPPVPPAKGALVVQPLPANSTTPRLFDAQGRALLPAPAASMPAPLPGYVQRKPQGDTQIMQHDSPVPYRPTRFADDWQRGGSSVDDRKS